MPRKLPFLVFLNGFVMNSGQEHDFTINEEGVPVPNFDLKRDDLVRVVCPRVHGPNAWFYERTFCVNSNMELVEVDSETHQPL